MSNILTFKKQSEANFGTAHLANSKLLMDRSAHLGMDPLFFIVFHFNAVFGKTLPKNRLPPPSFVSVPCPPWKSWIRHCNCEKNGQFCTQRNYTVGKCEIDQLEITHNHYSLGVEQ